MIKIFCFTSILFTLNCYTSYSQEKKYCDLLFSAYLDSVYSHSENLKLLKHRFHISELNSKLLPEVLRPALYFNFFNALQFGKSIDPTTNSFVDLSLMAIRPQLIGDIPLFSFGKSSQIKNYNELESNSISNEIQIEKSKLFVSALSDFLTIYLIQRHKNIYDSLIKKSSEIRQMVSEGYKLGKFSKLIYLQIDGRFKSDSLALTELMLRHSDFQNKMRLNFTQSDSTIFIAKLDGWISDFVEGFDYQIHKSIFNDFEIDIYSKFYLNKVQQTNVKIKHIKAEKMPSLSLVYSFSSIYAGILNPRSRDIWIDDVSRQLSLNFNQIAGINFSIPILNRNSIRNSLRKAELEKIFWTERYESAKNLHKKEYKNAYNNCVEARNHLNFLKELSKIQSEAVELAKSGVLLGKGTIIDFFSLENEFRNTRIKIESANCDFLFKVILFHELYSK